jgi:NAD(P)-dependent dehydrogenase (short-subunit alcohol dehydrogenase family)
MRLDGHVALVTGAGHRVGRALAVALGAERMNVAVHFNKSAKQADETVRLITEAGGSAHPFGFNLTDSAAPARLVTAVAKHFGKLHVLINSAAVMKRHPFGSVTIADWDETISLNLRAPFFVAQAASQAMTEGGAIVNISDLAAFETWPSYIPHSISKGGIVKMTEGLARVLAPSIRVNAIAPGAVLLPDDWGEKTGERLSDTTPLRRLGDPQDVVDAMLYLLRADYVTGETIIVDGGRRIRK